MRARSRQALTANRQGYTPEWRASPGRGDAGSAIDAILARYLEIQGDGLNAMPQRLQLEFLDALGASVLAPQPARAPLVFTLLATASGDATVPQGTRVAAVLPPPAPSLASDASAGTCGGAGVLHRAGVHRDARRAGGAVLDRSAGRLATPTTAPAPPGGFSVFNAMVPVPHRLYLGHGELFNFTGSAQIVLSFDFAGMRAPATATARSGPCCSTGNTSAATAGNR